MKKINKTQVFTDNKTINLMLDEVDYKDGLKIADISCGDGAFIKEIIKRTKTNFDKIYGFDIDDKVLNKKLNANIYKTKDSLTDNKIINGKFDIIIGNPPYLGYNECHKQKFPFFKKIKSKEIRLNNIFGINFHSTPLNPKKYSPKPNLFSFFIALGLKALKDKGILALLIPKTLLNSTDLDTLRYYLAKEVSILKIITFKQEIFKEKTSSMVIVIKKEKPENNHKVLIEDCLYDQEMLLNEHENWNIFLNNNYEIIKKYRNKTKDLSEYYTHKTTQEFLFDKGMVFGKNIIIPQGSQGLKVFEKKYRIIWRYMNYDGFYFEQSNEVIGSNYCIISSDNYDELLYLFHVLNSSLTNKIIDVLFKIEGEKDILLGIKAIKKHIRVPLLLNDKQTIIKMIKNNEKKEEIDKLISNILL
ncbi:MAG: Modification methylase TaqI [Alphaproteobacteria bacterium ADurb.Bin438]|nr:MAG: Modification methylase TaqI [Alphaproteobacteria bacterium ADurb.Bin438]